MTRPPQHNSAAYRAALHIHTVGPLTQEALFAAVDCSKKACNRAGMIERSIRTDWLVEIDGKIALGKVARIYFGDEPEPETPEPVTGTVATPRAPLMSVYERPALKYRTNSKGFRDDVPAFSVRENQSFRTVPGSST